MVASSTATTAFLTLEMDGERSKGNNLVIAADELLQVREKISKLYFKQRVIVAPCLSKLYFYCGKKEEPAAKENELESTSNWIYSATGLISVIFDEELNDVKLALFDRHSVYLHWCLKWADFICCQMPSSNFQIINTEADNEQYVGILYENKDVAELIARTVSLFYDSIQMADDCKHSNGVKTFPLNTKTKLRATQSDALLKMTKHSSFDNDFQPMEHKHEIRRSSLRGSLPRKLGRRVAEEFRRKDRITSILGNGNEVSNLIARRAINKNMPERPVSDCTDGSSTISLFSRADNFRKNRSHSLDVNAFKDVAEAGDIHTKKDKRQKSIGDNVHKESIIMLLFKKRRISRTQSLKIEDGDQCETNSGNSNYERPVRLNKHRSLTEPIILKDDHNILIKTALAAREERERRWYIRNLSQNKTPTTNLCNTEL